MDKHQDFPMKTPCSTDKQKETVMVDDVSQDEVMDNHLTKEAIFRLQQLIQDKSMESDNQDDLHEEVIGTKYDDKQKQTVMLGDVNEGTSASITSRKQKLKGVQAIANTIKDISSSQADFPIRIRIIRMFKIAKNGCPDRYISLNVIVIDEKGDRIHCVVQESAIKSFSHALEGHTYQISGYGVAFNNAKIKFVPHKYKLIFYRETVLLSMPIENIPYFGFNFVEFENILDNSLNDKNLIDVIGVLVGIGEIVPWATKENYKKQTNKKGGVRLNVQLMDLRKNVISCTFWDSYTEYFKPYLGCTSQDSIVVILQFAKVGFFNVPFVSNAYDGTKIYIDDDSVREIYEFKQRFNQVQVEGVTVSYISSEPSRGTTDIFLNALEHKTVAQINAEVQEKQMPFRAVTLATIDHIEELPGWYYNSCRVCKCKTKEESPGKSWCKKCNAYEENPVPRFCIHVTIVDHTGSAPVTIFDSEAVLLLNKQVKDILSGLNEDADFKKIPEEINDLVNRTLLFSLKVSDYNIQQLPEIKAYTVLNITAAKNLIQEFEKVAGGPEEGESAMLELEDSKHESSDSPGKRNRVIDLEDETIIKADFSSTRKRVKEEVIRD